jgi:hypothetical protein
MTKRQKLEFRKNVCKALEWMIRVSSVKALDGDPKWGQYASYAKKRGFVMTGDLVINNARMVHLTEGGERYRFETQRMTEEWERAQTVAVADQTQQQENSKNGSSHISESQ